MSNEITTIERTSVLDRINNVHGRIAVGTGLALGGLALVPSGALAAAGDPEEVNVDYGKLTSGATSQVEAVLPVALALIGTVTAIFVGWKFASKMLGAKKPA